MQTLEAGHWQIGILYEDNHLLCVEKPVNLPVQKDASGDLDLLTLLKGYIARKYGKPGEAYLGLVHRLDRPVGGTMVFARTSKAAARLSAQFAAHTVDKRYYAVLEGELDHTLELTDFLLADERTGMVRRTEANAPGAKLARLETRPIQARDGLTLCEVRLTTGRKHQIRVQNAGAGYPLWGDGRYGSGRPGMQIALWAHALEFLHPTLQTPVALTSSPPITGVWRVFAPELAGSDPDIET